VLFVLLGGQLIVHGGRVQLVTMLGECHFPLLIISFVIFRYLLISANRRLRRTVRILSQYFL
jgi:hypothetical protein